VAPRGQDVDPESVCPGFVIQALYLYWWFRHIWGHFDELSNERVSWELSVVRVAGSDPGTRRPAEARGSSSGKKGRTAVCHFTSFPPAS
jgi:hypothetical protein